MRFQEAVDCAGLDYSPGKRAIRKEYRGSISVAKNTSIKGSVDLDGHFQKLEPSSPRWDYGLCVSNQDGEFVVWIEPHSASKPAMIGEIKKKLDWLDQKLQEEKFSELLMLTQSHHSETSPSFYWLCTSKQIFAPTHKHRKILASLGLNGFPRRHIKIP